MDDGGERGGVGKSRCPQKTEKEDEVKAADDARRKGKEEMKATDALRMMEGGRAETPRRQKGRMRLKWEKFEAVDAPRWRRGEELEAVYVPG